ncbi:MAG: hypothetical protein RL709_671 [Pseudomonadota bacterium]|jgi:hypothetical protein
MTTIDTHIPSVEDTIFSKIPGEKFFCKCLQKELTFFLGNKLIKRGKLLLFKRTHYFIQITLFTQKKEKENFEIPFPFKVEIYDEEDIVYFDYRLDSLMVENLPIIQSKISSSYFNKILEISVAD